MTIQTAESPISKEEVSDNFFLSFKLTTPFMMQTGLKKEGTNFFLIPAQSSLLLRFNKEVAVHFLVQGRAEVCTIERECSGLIGGKFHCIRLSGLDFHV